MPVSTFLPGPAAAQARLVPADERLVHLDDPGQPVPARPDQHRPQPVQHRPRGRVGADLQRPLQALRRDAVLLRGEQPAGGEPHRQRRPRPVEDRARRHRRARMAGGALQPAIAQPPAPGMTAGRAGEPARPAQPLQVVQAVLIGAEPGLELARRPRVVSSGPGLLHGRILLRLTEYPRVALCRCPHSATTSPRTRPRSSRPGWPATPGSACTSHPPARPGSTRSSGGSAS